jgi:GTP-binding protein EngB required for normal cell division
MLTFSDSNKVQIMDKMMMQLVQGYIRIEITITTIMDKIHNKNSQAQELL